MTRFVRSRARLLVLLPVLAAALYCADPGLAGEWIKVGEGKLRGVSGMALLSHHGARTELLVVHDNKGAGEPRLGVSIAMDGKIGYLALEWPADAKMPVDLEAVASIPGWPGAVLAVTSGGQVFHLGISGTTVAVRGEFSLPNLPPEVNLEGFSAQMLSGRLVAVWGHRGAGPAHGILYWGLLDLPGGVVRNVASAEIVVPYPDPTDPGTRHISDLKLDPAGVVWASSTSDRGDSGPFASAVYTLGSLCLESPGTFRFERNPELTRLWVFPKKVEALELVPGPTGAIAFGTDDEDEGGSILFQ